MNTALGFLGICVLAAIVLATSTPVAAQCLEPAGDLNASGSADIADVQCSVITALWALSSAPAASTPTCLAAELDLADINCDGTISVVDVLLVIRLALSLPLDEQLDANGDLCVDACELPSCPADDVNTLLGESGAIHALYPLEPTGTGAIAFPYDGQLLSGLDADGDTLWTTDVGPGQLFGGFDFDNDGWPDAALAKSAPMEQICGTTPMSETHIVFVRGKTGQLVSAVAPLPDICWTFGSTTYPTSQWTVGTVLFGGGDNSLLLSPYYSTNSWFFHWTGASFTADTLYYPSTGSYDFAYPAAQPNAYGTGAAFFANSHVANGLVLEATGVERAVFFTSGRVVQYAVGPLVAGQLLADQPYLNGGRSDLAGRNYGLVTRDPNDPSQLALIAGTDMWSVYNDMTTNSMGTDEWGQIERHVTRYHVETGALDHRFYSSAHDNNDGNKYQNRVVYPATAYVPHTGPGPSRLAYNVYTDGHWYLHISQPGSTSDLFALKGVVLWDIRDLDGDGIAEWIITPSEFPSDPDVPGYYFTKWQTSLYHWDEATLSLNLTASYPGRIPLLQHRFREQNKSTSLGYLLPALTTRIGCERHFGTRTPAGAVEWISL